MNRNKLLGIVAVVGIGIGIGISWLAGASFGTHTTKSSKHGVSWDKLQSDLKTLREKAGEVYTARDEHGCTFLHNAVAVMILIP